MTTTNIQYTVKNNLCTGCGVCEDICPTHSISMHLINNEWKPKIKKETCINEKGCKKCFDVCSGHGINLLAFTKRTFEHAQKEDKYVGRYLSTYTGYSCDKDIRYHSSSGGLVTQFLIFLLEKKVIDGAVVTGYGKDHITPYSYIARNKEEILSAKGSKYCPVTLNKIGNEICKNEGKYIIVGLPCHIQGFRKREEIDSNFRKNVYGYFALYCSSNRNYSATEYLFQKYKVKKSKIGYFSFRDEGCLGSLIIKPRVGEYLQLSEKNNEDMQNLKVPYLHYYGRLRSFFIPHRCLSCIDHYGMLADISFGDIHIPPYSEDKVGVNSIIVRNSFYDNLLIQAKVEGFIVLNELDVHILNESQKTMLYPKKRKAKALMNLDKLVGNKIVHYDIEITEKPLLKDYISVYVKFIQRYIGDRSWLWWLIDLSNINKK